MYKIRLVQSFSLIFFIVFLNSGAAVGDLSRLEEYDVETCQETLDSVDLADLWDYFSSVQTDLYFNQESELIAHEQFWQDALSVLEIGSGNGAYLHKLSVRFKGKHYLGIEKESQLVDRANQTFAKPTLEFREGDAEFEYEELFGQYDVVIFRLTLQHLKNPWMALELAHQYLKPGGHVIIIDAYDPSSSSSHVRTSIKEVINKLNEQNKNSKTVNRQITIELLKRLKNENDSFKGLYDVEMTNLDEQGNLIGKRIIFESEDERKLCFKHALLLLSVLNRMWDIPVNIPNAYEELKVFLEDETSWISPGMHFLILKKI